MELFRIGFLSFGIKDLIDIGIVSALIYKMFVLIRGTRTAQMAVGLALLIVVASLAYWLEMSALSWLFSNLTTFGLLALVILFQPELRGILANIGLAGPLRPFSNVTGRFLIEEISRTTVRLAELKYGGLIIIEGRVGLRDYIETGKEMNAKFSVELVTTLFTGYTPLHDGAVIVSSVGQIAAAACTLPLTQNPLYRKLYGMRHKAGIGITELSDAVAIITSEENGHISIAHNGKLQQDIHRNDFRETLANYLTK
jgi:diadenylate cyclase